MPENGTGSAEDRRKWRYPEQSEHPDTEVYVYEQWCKACGICYSLCPKGVLSADKAGKAVVTDPDACIACYLCEILCPDMAITVYKERKKPAGGKKGDDE